MILDYYLNRIICFLTIRICTCLIFFQYFCKFFSEMYKSHLDFVIYIKLLIMEKGITFLETRAVEIVKVFVLYFRGIILIEFEAIRILFLYYQKNFYRRIKTCEIKLIMLLNIQITYTFYAHCIQSFHSSSNFMFK